jgi:hypothetical protein
MTTVVPIRSTRSGCIVASAAALALALAACGGANPSASTSASVGGSTAAQPSSTAAAPATSSAPVVIPTPTPSPVVIPTPTPSPIQTGPMSIGREIHTATRLADGRVLVTGGFDASAAALASAELYDPKTDRFSPTGSMTTARGFQTATLLADGRVLVVGGDSTTWHYLGTRLASAELYDPVTGTFSATGSLSAAVQEHTATRLADGRVLIAGGNDTDSTAVASAEIYDPKTGKFSLTGSMTTPRCGHTATLLADGRVLIAGGHPAGMNNGRGDYIASAEIYDPKSGTFSATGSMTTARAWHTATLLSNGRVLITGGTPTASSSLSSAEIYDPKSGKFSLTGAMADGRMFHTATLLSDGRVLVAGGCANGPNFFVGNFLMSAEIYDPKTGEFAATGSMAERRVVQGATLLADGRVLVTAGEGGSDVVAPLATAELFDPKTGAFSPAGSKR